MASQRRLELPTSSLGNSRSVQLSYWDILERAPCFGHDMSSMAQLALPQLLCYASSRYQSASASLSYCSLVASVGLAPTRIFQQTILSRSSLLFHHDAIETGTSSWIRTSKNRFAVRCLDHSSQPNKCVRLQTQLLQQCAPTKCYGRYASFISCSCLMLMRRTGGVGRTRTCVGS